MFDREGEAGFRTRERWVVKSLLGPVVVDLGGGAFCDAGSAEHLLRAGTVVFLDVGRSEAVQRLGDNPTRPLLREWPALEAHRRSLYLRAQLRVAVDGLTPEAVARRIAGLLERSR